MILACVTLAVIRTISGEHRGTCWDRPALRWSWESWLFLSRYDSAGELTFILTTGEGELTLMMLSKGSWLHPIAVCRWPQLLRLTNSATTQTNNKDLSRPAITSTPSTICWSYRNDGSCGKIPTGSLLLGVAMGCPRGVSVTIQCWWCTANQRP